MRIPLTIAALLLALSAQAADEVYRWVDKDGVVHYGAQPPSKDAKPAALPDIQTYSHRASNKALPIVPADASPKPLVAAIKELRIVAPVQDEIFRDPSVGINVSVAVSPGLPPGAGIIFYLDGAAKNARPLPSTSTTFNSVDRGEHNVTAAVVDATGKELLRSAPVTFHSKPPTAR